MAGTKKIFCITKKVFFPKGKRTYFSCHATWLPCKTSIEWATGPLYDPVTWYRINYAGTQLTQCRGLQSEGTLTSPARVSFILKVSLRYLRPSIIYSEHVTESYKGPISAIASRDGHLSIYPFYVSVMLRMNFLLKKFSVQFLNQSVFITGRILLV